MTGVQKVEALGDAEKTDGAAEFRLCGNVANAGNTV